MGCGKTKPHSTVGTQQVPQVVSFVADSAYRYIAEQVAFGPRVPGTEAHKACAVWLQNELKRHGAVVSVQEGTMSNYSGKAQPIVNIIGSFNPQAKNRILLCAHWDSRPWADETAPLPSPPQGENSLVDEGVPGANDGASGVGVLLEIARQLNIVQTKRGIDIVFFDAEDMGTPKWWDGKQREHTWCLGSQLWAQKIKDKGQRIKDKEQGTPYAGSKQTKRGTKDYQYGILLDMVGAPNAVFPREYYSEQYASNYVEQLWRTAATLGYTQYFSNARTYPITDDHYYVNTVAGIPCVDIIHYDPHSPTGFAPWWHTENDNMENISTSTLQAVGEVVLTMIR